MFRIREHSLFAFGRFIWVRRLNRRGGVFSKFLAKVIPSEEQAQFPGNGPFSSRPRPLTPNSPLTSCPSFFISSCIVLFFTNMWLFDAPLLKKIDVPTLFYFLLLSFPTLLSPFPGILFFARFLPLGSLVTAQVPYLFC